jgi:hypothetical protein
MPHMEVSWLNGPWSEDQTISTVEVPDEADVSMLGDSLVVVTGDKGGKPVIYLLINKDRLVSVQRFASPMSGETAE